jgi:hypothetical protein
MSVDLLVRRLQRLWGRRGLSYEHRRHSNQRLVLVVVGMMQWLYRYIVCPVVQGIPVVVMGRGRRRLRAKPVEVNGRWWGWGYGPVVPKHMLLLLLLMMGGWLGQVWRGAGRRRRRGLYCHHWMLLWLWLRR